MHTAEVNTRRVKKLLLVAQAKDDGRETRLSLRLEASECLIF